MIKNISVIGAGTMGHGIAHVFASHGYKVSLYDREPSRLDAALEEIRRELQFMVEEAFILQEDANTAVNQIEVFTDLATAVEDADYVIEAIAEDREAKKELFRQLDLFCQKHTILATNTSSLTLHEMIEDLPEERQKLCMVSHWYNPAWILPLVELSEFGNMDHEVFDEVYQLYIINEKQPVRIRRDIRGMVANRVLHAQAREVFHLIEEGAASPEDMDKVLKYGPAFRNATTGMFELADMGGLDVWCSAEDRLFGELDRSDKASDMMRNLVANGNLGIKTGKGFYRYSEEEQDSVLKNFYKRLLIQLKASENY